MTTETALPHADITYLLRARQPDDDRQAHLAADEIDLLRDRAGKVEVEYLEAARKNGELRDALHNMDQRLFRTEKENEKFRSALKHIVATYDSWGSAHDLRDVALAALEG